MTSKHLNSTPDRGSSITASRSSEKHERRNCITGIDRRSFLQAAGGLAATGLLAGCTDNGSGENPDQNGGDDENSQQSVEEWLSGTNNFNGITDKTGDSTVTVEVGPDSDEMVFEPAAIRIRPGTTVNWEWIGSGSHNVVAKGGLFNSGDPEEQASFEYTFDAAGTTLYYCDPHRAAGMKGAVIVEESGNSESTTSNWSE
ncbi:halocyanin domain-containing protein [Saliphagus sp. LR7]|uniref:halocyanin domain-containing protein n=1 Tax=Saliphagus sp. LR7 TaxID=2282654 RepID=UPI001E2D0602|nr:halocyanin domain-containing protein [Saliphagus sp. LR7]